MNIFDKIFCISKEKARRIEELRAYSERIEAKNAPKTALQFTVDNLFEDYALQLLNGISEVLVKKAKNKYNIKVITQEIYYNGVPMLSIAPLNKKIL